MTIKSVVKTVKILEALSANGEMGVTRLAQAVDMDKSTVFRILDTLKNLGYLMQCPDHQSYRLGLKFLDLAKSQMTLQGLIDRGHPYLVKLAIETGEASKLAVLEGPNALIVDSVESQHTIKVNVATGRQFSAHIVGIGKVILAYMDEEHVRCLFAGKPLLAPTDRTITSLDDLLEDLRLTRERGYAIDDEECSPGLYCLAAPVFDYGSHVAAGLSVSFPILRNKTRAERERITGLLLGASADISRELSGVPAASI